MKQLIAETSTSDKKQKNLHVKVAGKEIGKQIYLYCSVVHWKFHASFLDELFQLKSQSQEDLLDGHQRTKASS